MMDTTPPWSFCWESPPQMAIEDFFDDFMELLDAVSVEGATRATLEVLPGQGVMDGQQRWGKKNCWEQGDATKKLCLTSP